MPIGSLASGGGKVAVVGLRVDVTCAAAGVQGAGVEGRSVVGGSDPLVVTLRATTCGGDSDVVVVVVVEVAADVLVAD